LECSVHKALVHQKSWENVVWKLNIYHYKMTAWLQATRRTNRQMMKMNNIELHWYIYAVARVSWYITEPNVIVTQVNWLLQIQLQSLTASWLVTSVSEPRPSSTSSYLSQKQVSLPAQRNKYQNGNANLVLKLVIMSPTEMLKFFINNIQMYPV
jgi:hypothetical protein